MKKIFKSISIYALFSFLAVVNYACCGDTNYRIVGNGLIIAQDLAAGTIISENEDGIITGEFIISINHETEVSSADINLDILNSAYASIDCFETFENDLDSGTIQITSNNAILFDGESIAAGTNLTSIAELDYDINWASIFVEFNESFMSKADFSDQPHIFTVQIKTTDGLILENSIQLSFDLD